MTDETPIEEEVQEETKPLKKLTISEEYKKVNLIEEVKKICMEDCDAPSVFFDMMAYHAISATLGPFFRASLQKVQAPNIFCIMASVPGLTRRGTVLKLHNALVETTLMKYYKEIETISEDDAWKLVNLSKIESGTEAGICDAIIECIKGIKVSNKEVKLTSFRFSSPEFGDTLRRMSTNKDIDRGVDKLLCRFYSGEGYTQRLSQKVGPKEEERSRFIPEGLYFTMFSSMQEPEHYLNTKMVDSGLLRRVKIAYVKPSDYSMEGWKKPFQLRSLIIDSNGQLRKLASEDLVTRMIKYHKLLEELREDPERSEEYLDIVIAPDAQDILNEMARKSDEALKMDKSVYNICKQSDWEHVAKFAMIRAIGRDHWIKRTTKGFTPGAILVDVEDVNEAIQVVLNSIDANFEDVIASVSKTERMQEQELLIDRIEHIIRRAGSEGITRSDLARSLPGLSVSLWCEQVNTLLKQEKIVSVDILPEGNGKKPGRIYYHTDYRKQE